MIDLHGIVYAYHSYPTLNDLVLKRTSASLPFCSRYRLIDFALSAMTNAGVRDVGVVMQTNYQSLLDHLEGGKDWDLSRGSGGLSLLPPYGLYNSQYGDYKGCMDALAAIMPYLKRVKQNNIVLMRSDLAVNLDLESAFDAHIDSGAEITAICCKKAYDSSRDCIGFLPDDDGFSSHLQFGSKDPAVLQSIEAYIIRKPMLLALVSYCRENGLFHFHRDALTHYLQNGGRIKLFQHSGYCAHICSISDYYGASMDMLTSSLRSELFPEDRPVYTKGRSSVSTYYSENSSVKNSLVADGCYIEGEIENCVIFRGVRVKKGAKLKDCVILQDSVIGENASLSCVISDKNTSFSAGTTLCGSRVLPITVPKGKSI